MKWNLAWKINEFFIEGGPLRHKRQNAHGAMLKIDEIDHLTCDGEEYKAVSFDEASGVLTIRHVGKASIVLSA